MSDNAEYAPSVPRAVREQAERAEQLARELGAANVTDVPPEEREQGGDGTPPSPPEQREPEEYRPPQREPEEWEQRYRTLQGKYDSEMGHMRGQLASMERLIASMQTAPPPPAPAPVAPQITDEDREMWGDDLPQAVSRWVGNAASEEVRQLRAEVEYLKGGQQRHDVSLTQHSVMSQLDMDPDLAGRWRQLNDNPRYLQWLSEIDQFSARPRLELLREAYAQGDANRTGRFFKTYLAEHTAPPVSRSPAHTMQNGSAPAGRMRLEELAAPGRAAASGTNGGASPERRMWTNREIGAFYRDVQRGVYRSRQADKDRIEADILAAASEGRVFQ
jgi:hypothetical protein